MYYQDYFLGIMCPFSFFYLAGIYLPKHPLPDQSCSPQILSQQNKAKCDSGCRKHNPALVREIQTKGLNKKKGSYQFRLKRKKGHFDRMWLQIISPVQFFMKRSIHSANRQTSQKTLVKISRRYYVRLFQNDKLLVEVLHNNAVFIMKSIYIFYQLFSFKIQCRGRSYTGVQSRSPLKAGGFQTTAQGYLGFIQSALWYLLVFSRPGQKVPKATSSSHLKISI